MGTGRGWGSPGLRSSPPRGGSAGSRYRSHPHRQSALASAALAIGLLALLASCTAVGFRSKGWASPPKLRAPAYYEELERATWYESLYVGLDLRAFLAITWRSPALQHEQVMAIGQMQALSQEEETELLVSKEEEQERYLDFLLSLYTVKRSWNDLAAKDSIWRVELVASGGAVFLPISIERIHQPDANLIALYPFINRFATTYRIRFPAADEAGEALLPPGARRLQLRLVSAVARSEPHWSLDEAGRVGAAAN